MDKYQEFTKGLEEINEKHKEYFNNREAIDGREGKDKLEYHIRIQNIDGGFGFGKVTNSNLSKEIYSEVESLAKSLGLL